MDQTPEGEGSQRIKSLRNLLTHLREKQSERVRQLKRDRAGDALTEPGDSLDLARSSEDAEVHSDLLGRAEDVLSAIHAAFERLDEGDYGMCQKCRREIDLGRLRIVPFAAYCSDCEKTIPAGPKRDTTSDEFLHHWTVPEGMVETLGGEEPLELPEGNPSELAGETFVPAPKAEPYRLKAPQKKSQTRRKR